MSWIPMQYNELTITSSTTADQIAQALSCQHTALDATNELFYNGDTYAGFAVTGIGTDTLNFYAYYNSTVQTNALMTITPSGAIPGKLRYYERSDEFVIASSSQSSVDIAFIKGIDPNDGSAMWGYYTTKAVTGTTNYGYIFDKYSTNPFNMGSSWTKRVSNGLKTVAMCPMFNVNTGFFATGRAYYITCFPNFFNLGDYSILIGDKEYKIHYAGTSSSNYVPIAFDVEYTPA